jgi:hypothetical protein
VDPDRRNRTCALDGGAGTLDGSDMAAEISRRNRKSQW